MSINEYQINKLRGSTRPFEKAIIEYICLDTFVYIPNRKTLLSRPWLTILLDDYSKKVLAFYLSLNGPSYISNMIVFCNRKMQNNAIKNAEVCHPISSFLTVRGTVYNSHHGMKLYVRDE